MINTKRVTQRRPIRYESYDDVLADAERLAQRPVVTLGNWSPGQVFAHLAMACDVMIDGAPAAPPKPIQWLLRFLLKRRFLTQGLPAGFALKGKSAVLVPGIVSTDEGLARLRAGFARLRANPHRAPHPGFGVITPEEWDAFHLRHCELHMSFLQPQS
jgi:hypothetical protein